MTFFGGPKYTHLARKPRTRRSLDAAMTLCGRRVGVLGLASSEKFATCTRCLAEHLAHSTQTQES